MKNSPFMDPLMFGWTSEEDKFEFSWFEGDQSPEIQEILTQDTATLEEAEGEPIQNSYVNSGIFYFYVCTHEKILSKTSNIYFRGHIGLDN